MIEYKKVWDGDTEDIYLGPVQKFADRSDVEWYPGIYVSYMNRVVDAPGRAYVVEAIGVSPQALGGAKLEDIMLEAMLSADQQKTWWGDVNEQVFDLVNGGYYASFDNWEGDDLDALIAQAYAHLDKVMADPDYYFYLPANKAGNTKWEFMANLQWSRYRHEGDL